jgi:hypothetical protein
VAYIIWLRIGTSGRPLWILLMNVCFPWNIGNFLTSWVTVSFSRRTVLQKYATLADNYLNVQTSKVQYFKLKMLNPFYDIPYIYVQDLMDEEQVINWNVWLYDFLTTYTLNQWFLFLLCWNPDSATKRTSWPTGSNFCALPSLRKHKHSSDNPL